MNTLSNLPSLVGKKKKRRGRGYGSGTGGHTVGRGQKGQNSRNKPHLLFEGKKTQKSLLRRIPLLRGKGKLKPRKKGPVIVNISFLNLLPNKSEVNLALLIKNHLVDEKEAKCYGVKILGGGQLERVLTVVLPCSKGAREKIKKAGGKVTIKTQKVEIPKTKRKKSLSKNKPVKRARAKAKSPKPKTKTA